MALRWFVGSSLAIDHHTAHLHTTPTSLKNAPWPNSEVSRALLHEYTKRTRSKSTQRCREQRCQTCVEKILREFLPSCSFQRSGTSDATCTEKDHVHFALLTLLSSSILDTLSSLPEVHPMSVPLFCPTKSIAVVTGYRVPARYRVKEIQMAVDHKESAPRERALARK